MLFILVCCLYLVYPRYNWYVFILGISVVWCLYLVYLRYNPYLSMIYDISHMVCERNSCSDALNWSPFPRSFAAAGHAAGPGPQGASPRAGSRPADLDPAVATAAAAAVSGGSFYPLPVLRSEASGSHCSLPRHLGRRRRRHGRGIMLARCYHVPSPFNMRGQGHHVHNMNPQVTGT